MDILLDTAWTENQARNIARTRAAHSEGKKHTAGITGARGAGWGFIGGFTATFVMDACLIGALSAAGMPALTCFSIVGDTVARFFAILGIDAAGSIPLGVAAHYVIGPAIGTMFGGIMAKRDACRVGTWKRSVLLAVLYVEILSQPLLVLTPILTEMTASDTVQWYGVSAVMHFIAGAVLGLIVHYGLRASPGIYVAS